MAEINVGAISEALNDKVDRDNRNVDNTAGADAVIEYQVPTAENGYTWYRRYASGWVEQGGVAPAEQNYQVVLPFQMYDNNYYISITGFCFSGNYNAAIHNVRDGTKTTTGFQIQCRDYNNGSYITSSTWEVKGMMGIGG